MVDRPAKRRAGRFERLLVYAVSCLLAAFCAAVPVAPVAGAAPAGGVSVSASVEKDTVAMGEPFVLQIRVDGADMPSGSASPDLTALEGFTVEFLGRQNNSRSSITIINGKMTKEESRGYIDSYRLTASKTGEYEIPAIPVAAGSKTLQTRPIALRVAPPETSEDFRLELSFSKTKFYVGEPVVLTVTWYLGRDVESAAFNLPIMEQKGLTLSDPKVDQEPGKQYYQVPLGQGTVVAEKGSKNIDGKPYMTLTFKKLVHAVEAGAFDIPSSTASCRVVETLSRPRSQRPGNPLESFFNDDFFSSGRKNTYKTLVAVSGPVALTVMPLPEAGRPADFSGCVGEYRIETAATPTEVSVGDPITLTATISGPEYLDNVELPSLAHDPELEKDFKIPDEVSAGVVRDGSKVFTRTLRARSDGVRVIPPIGFSYFDPERGEYRVAGSNPIPIQVKPARVVTEADIEGREPGVRVRSELEDWSQGIAHNYEGPDILEDQGYRLSSLVRSPAWVAASVVPFLGYVSLLIFVTVRRRRTADPRRDRSRKAFAVFRRKVEKLAAGGESGIGGDAHAVLLEAVRTYLGDRLALPAASLTFLDVRRRLEDHGVDAALTARIGELFAACEQGSYGGGASAGAGFDELVRNAVEVVGTLDRSVAFEMKDSGRNHA